MCARARVCVVCVYSVYMCVGVGWGGCSYVCGGGDGSVRGAGGGVVVVVRGGGGMHAVCVYLCAPPHSHVYVSMFECV